MPIMRASAAIGGGQNNAAARRLIEANQKENQRKSFSAENRKSKASMSNNNIANNNQGGIAAYGSQIQFTTSFQICRKKDDTPACFKQDGERFDHGQTLKLLSCVDYIIKMEICPAMELLYVKFAGIEHNFSLVNDPEKDNKSVYQFQWSTRGIDATISRHRTDVLCAMKFKNYKEIDFRLQVKFYTVDHIKHATWGDKLKCVTLDCTAGRGMYSSGVEEITCQ